MQPHALVCVNSPVFSDAAYERFFCYLSDLLVEILYKMFFVSLHDFILALKSVWLNCILH
jgi:hypothetical protein